MNNNFQNRQNNNKQTPLNMTVKEIKDGIIKGSLSIVGVLVSIMESIFIVGGVLGANIADIAFGTMALMYVFQNANQYVANISVFGLNITPMSVGLSISLGTSAIQIYLWSLLRERNITFGNLIRGKIDKKYQSFMVGGFSIWAADTALDLFGVSLLISPTTPLFAKVIVYFLAFLLCGFAEPLTANMSEMFEEERNKVGSQNSYRREEPKSYPPVGSVSHKPANTQNYNRPVQKQASQQNSFQPTPKQQMAGASGASANTKAYLSGLQENKKSQQAITAVSEFDEEDVDELMKGFEELRGMRNS